MDHNGCEEVKVDGSAPPVELAATAEVVEEQQNPQKRTRRGEKFTPPTEVNLHANDFEWDSLLDELPDADRSLFEAYSLRCQQVLSSIRNQLHDQSRDPCPRCYFHSDDDVVGQGGVIPSTDASTLSVVPVGADGVHCTDRGRQQHDPAAWERHYTTNRMHFPTKNYIVHAFPSLVPLEAHESHYRQGLERLWAAATAPRQSPSSSVIADHTTDVSGSTMAVPPPLQRKRRIMEAGCGTGSVTHPLMKLFPRDAFVCFDVSATAVEQLATHDAAAHHKEAGLLTTFVLDLSKKGHALDDQLAAALGDEAAEPFDVILLIFVLSAMPSLEHMVHVLRQLRSVLKPGTGRLLFRDYGALDHNFFRFHRQQNVFIADSLTFLKGDGTEQFFYDKPCVESLFALAGLGLVSSDAFQYHCNRIVNRKNGKRMDKVFVNAELMVIPFPVGTW